MSLPRSYFPNPLYFAVSLTLALAGLWIAEPYLWEPTFATRIMFAGLTIVASLTTARLAMAQTQQEFVRIERYLEMLFRVNLTDLSAQERSDLLHEPRGFSGWKRIVSLVQNSLLEQTSRLEEAEITRQNSEVRLRRLASEKDELLEIVSGLSEPILAVNRYGEIVLANDAFLDLFDIRLPQGEKTTVGTVISNRAFLDLIEETRRRRSHSARAAELELTDKEGRSRWFRVLGKPLASEGDVRKPVDHSQPHGALAVLNDITAQKVIQKRNAEFVSAVSHEMKTPLSSIKAYVELLADGEAEDEETREEFLSVINGQTDRLQRLIDNLLNIARIEAGVVRVNKEPRSLNEILHEAAEVIRPAAEKKHIQFSTDLSPLYLGVLADRDALLQAAINLLSNAVKYTREGGRMILRSRLTDDTITFEVEDSGVGLSPEDCSKVFEKFYRVKKDKDMAAGTGLGLPLVKHIVEDVHGGRVEVRSELGVGSTFHVSLPQDRHNAN